LHKEDVEEIEAIQRVVAVAIKSNMTQNEGRFGAMVLIHLCACFWTHEQTFDYRHDSNIETKEGKETSV
jgi:hypothetical protein